MSVPGWTGTSPSLIVDRGRQPTEADRRQRGVHRGRLLTRILAATVAFAVCGAPLRAADDPSPGEYDLAIVSHATPGSIEQWSAITVPLVLRNEGTVPWEPGVFNVAYHWLSPQGELLVRDGHRTPLPGVVGPGEEVRLEAHLQAPKQTGTFLLQWDVVEENVTWISEHDPTAPSPISISITPGILTHGFTLLRHETPRVMFTGQQREITMRLRNDGTETWEPDEQINLSYHWHHRNPDKTVFDGERSSLPRTVAKGEDVELVATLHAPLEFGVYRLQWDMVHENVTWFDALDPTPVAAMPVLVLPNPLRGPRGAFVVALLLLGFTVYATRGSPKPRWGIAAASVADLLWLGSALLLKQSVVLDEAARPPADGHLMFVAAGTALVVVVAALIPRIARPWVALVINIMVSLVILADLVYFRFFGDVISAGALGAAGQAGQVRESIGSLLAFRDLWLFLDLLPGALILLLVLDLRSKVSRRPAHWLALMLTPLIIPGCLAAWRISSAEEGKFVQVFQNVFIVQEIGILNYHAFDAWSEIRSSLTTPALTSEREAEIETWFRSTAPRRAGTGPLFGAARGSNLVMLQVESMQSFVIGLEIEGQEITPHLNRWRESQNVSLSECIDQTAQGRTSDGEFLTQTSLLPLPAGAVAFRFGDNRYDAIGDILAAHGYETISAVPFDGAFWNRLVTHPEYGYRNTLFADEFEPGVRVGWGLNDRDFLLQMAPRLEDLPSPFAAFLLTLSNHHPYDDFPEELEELDLGRWEDTSIGNYLHSMHFFDAAFQQFLDRLDHAGILDDTVIAVWGDHTAGLPWDEDLGALSGLEPTEKNFYIAEQIPFFIRIPGDSAIIAPRTRCAQMDVAPTLLSLLGIDPAPYPFLGRNLFGNPDGPIVRRYGAWLDDELLYIGKGRELEAGRCYEISSMKRLPVERCRAGHAEAAAQKSVSRDVIRYDLHHSLAEALQQQQR